MNFRHSVVSVVEAMVTDLRRRILSGDLEPGRALGEVELAAMYEVSRPTARSAIDSLVGARLLTRGVHKTARVVTLTPQDVDDIYGTRALIETEAVRRLASRRYVPKQAAAANAEIARLAESSPEDVIKPDIMFHRALIDALGSERSSAVYAVLADELELCMARVQSAHLLDTEHIIDEHQQILHAIGDGNGDLAASLMARHLGNAREKLRERIVTVE